MLYTLLYHQVKKIQSELWMMKVPLTKYRDCLSGQIFIQSDRAHADQGRVERAFEEVAIAEAILVLILKEKRQKILKERQIR